MILLPQIKSAEQVSEALIKEKYDENADLLKKDADTIKAELELKQEYDI